MDKNEKEIKLKLLREISDELWRLESGKFCIKFPNVYDTFIRRHDAVEILRKRIIELASYGEEFRRVMRNE